MGAGTGIPPLDRVHTSQQNHSLHLATRRWEGTSPWDCLCQRLEHMYSYIPSPVQVEYEAVLDAVVGSLHWLAKVVTRHRNSLIKRESVAPVPACQRLLPVE